MVKFLTPLIRLPNDCSVGFGAFAVRLFVVMCKKVAVLDFESLKKYVPKCSCYLCNGAPLSFYTDLFHLLICHGGNLYFGCLQSCLDLRSNPYCREDSTNYGANESTDNSSPERCHIDRVSYACHSEGRHTVKAALTLSW